MPSVRTFGVGLDVLVETEGFCFGLSIRFKGFGLIADFRSAGNLGDVGLEPVLVFKTGVSERLRRGDLGAGLDEAGCGVDDLAKSFGFEGGT